MKQPATFNTGEPSYFAPASTLGSRKPSVLTRSNATADCRHGFGVIDPKYRHTNRQLPRTANPRTREPRARGPRTASALEPIDEIDDRKGERRALCDRDRDHEV